MFFFSLNVCVFIIAYVSVYLLPHRPLNVCSLAAGGYVVVQEKLPNYVVPDLTDFKVNTFHLRTNVPN